MSVLAALFLQPAVVVSLVVLAGLLFQKKPFAAVATGTVKSLIGYEMILVGGTLVGDASHPLMEMLSRWLGVSGTVLNVEAATGVVLEKYGMDIALVMILGLIVNVILARITRFHYVFLTGHQAMYMAALIVSVLRTAGLSGAGEIICGAVAAGSAMVLSPAILQPYTERICGSDRAALGHFGSSSYFIAAKMGEIFGDREQSAETLELPRWLSFIRDTSVILFLTMAAMNLLAAAAAGPAYVEGTLSGGQNWLVFAVGKAVYFTIGFTVISTGVRWMIDEIVPAVRGIAQVFVPHARPTIDCPLVFPYAPNALVIGFLSSFVGGILSMGLMAACHLPIVLPGAVPHFFCGATAGVYGNSTGGARGAALGGFVNGCIISFVPLLAYPYIGPLKDMGVAFADADFGLVAVFLGSRLADVGLGGTLAILFCIIALMILIPESLENREPGVPWFIEERNRHVYRAGKIPELDSPDPASAGEGGAPESGKPVS